MPKPDVIDTDDLSRLPKAIVDAVIEAPVSELDGSPAVSELADRLSEVGDRPWPGVDEDRRRLCASGLWLLAGDLDRSHTISQSNDSPEGSFWHGIMHRREGDFGNAKYWFRRVGAHPVFDRLASENAGSYVDPFQFVDACEQAIASGGSAAESCQQTQWAEWQLLMKHCLG